MGRRNSNYRTSFVVIAFSCVLLPSAGLAQQGGRTLVGKVTTQEGGVIGSGLTLRLETEEGNLIDQQMGSADGRFEFDNLNSGVYRLRAAAPGFEPLNNEVDLTGPRVNVYVGITLVLEIKLDMTGSDLPALTDGAASKKARKEYEKGKQSLKKGSINDAASHFGKAVDEYPCYARAQSELARVLVMENKMPAAEAALKKSISCDGGYLVAYLRLGILLNGTRRYEESERTLQEGIRHSPSAWILYYQLGPAHSGMGHLDQAQMDYQKVRELNPTPPSELHVRMADLYHRMGAFDKAYAEMQAYLHEDPNGRFAEKTKAVMRQLESSGAVHLSQSQKPAH